MINFEENDRGVMSEEIGRLEASLTAVEDDDMLHVASERIGRLSCSERRLFLVYVLLDSSITKTAAYFDVNRKTVSNKINEIRQKIDTP